MKTYSPSKSEVKTKWHLVDAKNKVLGRVATEIATLLTGKNKPTYAPYINSGDVVVVINAEKVALTGTKELHKIYHFHSGQVGNSYSKTAEQIRRDNPKHMIFEAVNGMLPKNKLRNDRLANLKIYVGEEHPHQGQIAEGSKE